MNATEWNPLRDRELITANDSDLLGILLGSREKGIALREACGTFSAMLAAGTRGLSGLGLETEETDRILAALEIGRRLWSETPRRGMVLDSSDRVFRLFRGRFRAYRKELLAGLFLDGRNRLVATRLLARGTVNYGHVCPREVLAECLRVSASGLILVHNHPAGDPSPSFADIELTRRLGEALSLIDVRLVDHLVVTEGRYVSLAAIGRWEGTRKRMRRSIPARRAAGPRTEGRTAAPVLPPGRTMQ